MSCRKTGWLAGAALVASIVISAPLSATVRDGVEAWSRGDYAAAVAEWRGPAEAGDADAMFNMGQAYRLGRGVPQDMELAEEFYARAAQAGHVQAGDTYGLLLFQSGRREAALPFVEGAARRGDPRAQYLLGIAHFNGDLAPRDWERAYALLTLANGAGLPQAAAALAQMDAHIPIDQRQSAAGLALQLNAEAERARAVELAAADLAVQDGPPTGTPPRPIPTTAVSPSIAAARDAVQQAREATGTASPAEAGASYAGGQPVRAAPPVASAEAPQIAAAPASAPAPPPASAPQIAASAARASGPWRVQLGAFGVAGNAERLWNRLASRPELAGRERLLLPTGRVTRLQAGGFGSQAEAQSACDSLRRAGQDCLVTRN